MATPVRLYYDNVSTMCMTANPVHHDHSKHIAINYHFVRERVAAGELVVCYIPTMLQIADIFPKGLSSQQFFILESQYVRVSPQQVKGT